MSRIPFIVACVAILGMGALVPSPSAAGNEPACAQTPQVSNHGGRTDKDGCHMDRKRGTRHCH